MPIAPAIDNPGEVPIEIVPREPGARLVSDAGLSPAPTNPLCRYRETDQVWHDGTGWRPIYEPEPRAVEDCRAVLHDQVAAIRRRLERQGLSYAFPDGITSIIQTRDDTDIRNIQGNTTAAVVLQAQGIVDAVLTFRSADNINHALTPAEAIQMGMAVAARVSGLYAAKWTHDEAIDALDTVEACLAYDIHVGWPEG